MKNPFHVLILGAGPGGLFLANLLAQRSSHYRITIYEKRPDPRLVSQRDRAFSLGLMKRGRHTLQQIPGLWEAVLAQGISVSRTVLYSLGKQKWQTMLEVKPEDAMVLIQRDRLCQVLLDHLETYENQIELHFNAPAEAINLKEHFVTIGSIPGAQQSYDLLIGADGVNSLLRSRLLHQSGFDFQQSYFKAVWKAIPLDTPPGFESGVSYLVRRPLPAENSMVLSNRLTGGLIPIAPQRHCLLLFWEQLSPESEQNPPPIIQATDWQTYISQWLPGVTINNHQAQSLWDMPPVSILEIQCSRYHDLPGKVILLGDAAHGMSSQLGQGCQSALSDALALANLLTNENDRLETVLPMYSAQQVPEGHAITRLNTELTPKRKWVALLYGIATVIQTKLYGRSPGVIFPPLWYALSQTTIPYTEIARRLRFWMRLIRLTNPPNSN